MNRLKFLPLFSNIVLILLIGTMFISCKNDIETVNKITKINKLPTFEVDTFEIIYSDSGIVKVKIEAPKFIRYEKRIKNYDEYEKGINVSFFNQNKTPAATLTCNYARYFVDEELWEAKFNVEIINKVTNEKINTEQLFWNMKKELIYSEKFVKISRPNEILWGEGFESNQDFSKYRILKLAGTINVNDK